MAAEQVERVFVIADLSGYTALTEAHGNVQAAHVVSRYFEIVQALIEPGARLVDHVGDEVLIAIEDAATAVRTAVKLREAVEHEPLFPTVRSGIHAGFVVEQGHTYYGSALNLTARLAGHARAGQILCSEPVRLSARSLDAIDYQPLGAVRFKNIIDPIPVFEVVARGRDSETIAVDPVCRMQVRPETAPARLPFGGHTFYFCSFQCARTFAERPDRYTRILPPA
jgi:class 3 adenylate cyclase/YHS domain-containing protein